MCGYQVLDEGCESRGVDGCCCGWVGEDEVLAFGEEERGEVEKAAEHDAL